MMKKPKLPSLRDLSRELPGEISQVLEDIERQSDRGAALMGSTLVEKALWLALYSRLLKPDKKMHAEWFDSPTAPFGSFSAKIKLGRALAIYGPITEKQLVMIKDIRNAFAHALRPLGFDNATISAACEKLSDTPPLDGGSGSGNPMRIRFLATCTVLFNRLIDDAKENGGKPLVINLP